MIDPRSADYTNVASLGLTVKRGSLKHWLIFIAADVRMSTHLFLFAPAAYVGEFIKRHHTRHTVNVDLQHGITHNTFPSTYKKANGSDLYICGAKPEYEWVRSNFGWDKASIQYTGFARFDGLYDSVLKKQILIMPTWRTELRDVSEEGFLQSDYYLQWRSLIDDPKLLDLAKENNSLVVFYIHYSLRRFAHCFKSNSDVIQLALFEESDVQELLKESILLVTDYSSVFFDFAYMGKPVIYFQFDYDAFYSKHYKEGFFNHAHDGFGPVCSSEDDVIRAIVRSAANGFKMANKYASRAVAFFPLHDTKNCERIYQAILERKHEQKSN